EMLSGSAAFGACAWAAAAFGAAWALRERPKAGRLALLWLASYALLYTNWQPTTVVYRYTDVPALWLLLACAVEAARPTARLGGAALGCLAVFLAAWNAGASILPGSRPELNADLQRALWLQRETPEDAWIAVHATEQVYVPYFSERRPLNIRYFAEPEALKARVRAARAAGEPVYAVPEVLPDWASGALEQLGWKQVSQRRDERLFLIK
ncbi:MAG: hypothetical protein HY925_06845, partial [Elusimicrobia bacterium]|nr:hypothetical protein [Elusimicrobiota bacterium]